jgi:hypothetical protein
MYETKNETTNPARTLVLAMLGCSMDNAPGDPLDANCRHAPG